MRKEIRVFQIWRSWLVICECNLTLTSISQSLSSTTGWRVQDLKFCNRRGSEILTVGSLSIASCDTSSNLNHLYIRKNSCTNIKKKTGHSARKVLLIYAQPDRDRHSFPSNLGSSDPTCPLEGSHQVIKKHHHHHHHLIRKFPVIFSPDPTRHDVQRSSSLVLTRLEHLCEKLSPQTIVGMIPSF